MEKLLKFEYEEAIRETASNFHELYRRIEEQERLVITKLELERDEAMELIHKQYTKVKKLVETRATMIKDNSIMLTDKEIDKCTKNMLNVTMTKLTWDMETIEPFLESLCQIEDVEKYTTPYWSKITRGMEEYEIETPRGMAIDPSTNYIYIVDSGDHTDRVQVFDDYGVFLHTLSDPGEIKSPFGIYLHDDTIYLTCMDTPTDEDQTSIAKMDKATGIIELLKETDDPIYHPFVDSENDPTILIYGCGMYNHRLHVFDTFLNTTEESPINMNTINNHDEIFELEARTKVMSCKVFDGEVFLLLAFTEFPVQVFDMTGILQKKLVDNKKLLEPFSFCFDIFNNMIIADRGQNCVNLYSSVSGIFLREIGEGAGADIGQFVGPKGIVIGRKQQYIIVDSKDIFTLQAF
ncbi:hypothetical protein LOD99_4478 [Oopsacas minuta]|uniref:Uncharacterized protein n=1 Tax=Oopsacas minuta TaxID=111878 RepID=A0AAV7JVF4_9METZ|nr:hypothetical protein LOD99_4478 [Oopsacas minuta]